MNFIRDFEEKVIDINDYFDFIFLVSNINEVKGVSHLRKAKLSIHVPKSLLYQKIEGSGSFRLKQNLIKMLKATLYLQLYNLVESGIVSALNEYFDKISSERLSYKDANSYLRRIWINYKHKLFVKTTDIQFVSKIDDIFKEIIEILPKQITREFQQVQITNYDAYRSEISKPEISGNLDARKIRDLADIYGFLLPRKKECNSLVTVKNNRNKLAHGENSFSEIGKDTLEDLFVTKEETIHFTRSILKYIEKSINKPGFFQT